MSFEVLEMEINRFCFSPTEYILLIARAVRMLIV